MYARSRFRDATQQADFTRESMKRVQTYVIFFCIYSEQTLISTYLLRIMTQTLKDYVGPLLKIEYYILIENHYLHVHIL